MTHRVCQHGFYARPAAHLATLSTRDGLGTISVVQTLSASFQGGVVKTFRCPLRGFRLQYEYADFEFAMSAIRVLAIVCVVAFVSYAAKSRSIFLAGTLGSLLGCVAPHGYTHINGTAEACYMGYLHWTASKIRNKILLVQKFRLCSSPIKGG